MPLLMSAPSAEFSVCKKLNEPDFCGFVKELCDPWSVKLVCGKAARFLSFCVIRINLRPCKSCQQSIAELELYERKRDYKIYCHKQSIIGVLIIEQRRRAEDSQAIPPRSLSSARRIQEGNGND